jgi:hypothetical protein
MSCGKFISAANLSSVGDISTLSTAAFKAGQGCMNKFYDSCSDICQSSNTTSQCYACLSNSSTCSINPSEITNIQPCCPLVQSAVECGRCISQNPNDPNSCITGGGGLNDTTKWVLIGVGSAVGFILFIVGLIWWYRRKYKKQQQMNINTIITNHENQNQNQNFANLLEAGIDPSLIESALK